MKLTRNVAAIGAMVVLVAAVVLGAVVLLNPSSDGDASSVSVAAPGQPDPGVALPDPGVALPDPGVALPDPGARVDPDDTVDLAPLVGMTLADAEAWAEARGMLVRPVVIDGEPLAVTEDFSLDRINVELKAGVVSVVQGLG